jgi:hypothetical protein
MNISLSHEIFSLVIILAASGLLLAGKITNQEWEDVVQWLGVAVITGKSAQAVVSARGQQPQQLPPAQQQLQQPPQTQTQP